MNLTVDRKTRSYLDFVQGLKSHSMRETLPALAEVYADRERREEAEAGRKPSNWKEAQRLMKNETLWKFYEHVTHYSQHMMWWGVLHIVDENKETIERELNASIPDARGSLQLKPGMELPRYYEQTEFHLRPGGMWDGEAQGFYTDVANWVYFGGSNDNRGMQYQAAAALPDRDYKRVIDLACGIGQSTWPLAERFPNAEIHGTDLSAPLLTYAQKAAEERNLAIHYRQNNVEHTDYPDDNFDLAFAFILFHEIPDNAAVNVINEAYRIVEPGGVFAIAAIQPYRNMTPFRAFVSDYQTYGNGEAFWRSHCSRDFSKLLTDAGFVNAREATSEEWRSQIVYMADKPA